MKIRSSERFDPFFTTRRWARNRVGVLWCTAWPNIPGGNMILRSQKGRGTTAELGAAAKKTMEATRPRRLPRAQQRHAGMIVLVVDDDPLSLPKWRRC